MATRKPGERALTLLQLAVIAVVQGITEFLPISSSGHLRLIPLLSDWPDQGLAIDIAVHVGTLFAVLAYLWRDVLAMLGGLVRIGSGMAHPGVRMIVYLAVATVPVMAAGYALTEFVGTEWRNSLEVIAWATLGFGLLLHLSDRIGLTVRRIEHMGLLTAFAIGLAQALALIPGASRAGVTMTAARVLGFERRDAARFSMLMSIPTIVAAGAFAARELVESGDPVLQSNALLAGGIAFVAALIAIAAMMGWLRRATFAPFAIYRVFLGGGLLGLVYL